MTAHDDDRVVTLAEALTRIRDAVARNARRSLRTADTSGPFALAHTVTRTHVDDIELHISLVARGPECTIDVPTLDAPAARPQYVPAPERAAWLLTQARARDTRLLLAELDADTVAHASPARLAHSLGRLEGVVERLLDAVDAVNVLRMPTLCGLRRPGWGEGVGRHRLLCVRDAGHVGDHTDAAGETWTSHGDGQADA